MTDLIQHYMHWTVFWCAIRGRHKGAVGFLNGGGPVEDRVFWMCDNCGAVER